MTWHLDRRLASRIYTVTLLLAITVVGARSGPVYAAEPATVSAPGRLLQAPVPFAAGNVEEWTVGHGLVYRAHNCYADEFNSLAALHRRAASGGPERELESISDGNRCNTYNALASGPDGLYYYDASSQRIVHFSITEPPVATTFRDLSSADAVFSRLAFALADGYLYWSTADNRILRTVTPGEGPLELVANTTSQVSELMIIGAGVYSIEQTGVWLTSTACGGLPCPNRVQFAPFAADTRGNGLLHHAVSGPGPRGRYRVYWVERTTAGTNVSYAIRYRACDIFSVCTLDTINTFYSSVTNWRIGQLLYSAGNVFWTERDENSPTSPHGDVKRRAWNAPAQGADLIATGQTRVDDRLFVAGDLLYFARRSDGIHTLPLAATVIERDFALEHLEITQGIQDLATTVPLVATRATYVRAYATQRTGPSAPNVEAHLVAKRLGAEMPGSPLKPLVPVRGLITGGSYDRDRLDDGWYFVLPAAWTAFGPLDITVVVDPRQIHSDPNRGNNIASKHLVFLDKPPVCVMTVPVMTNTPLPSTEDPNFWTMVDHFYRRWPVPDVWVYRDTDPVGELETCWYGPFPYPCGGPYELDEGWGLINGIPDRDKVITALWTRALLTFNPDECDNLNAPVHFMGLVHPDAENGGAAGYASTVSKQSWVQLPDHAPLPDTWNAMREGSTMAQELAHNYGRKHIDCGDPEDVDSSYPYPPCQIAPVDATGYYGFDIRTLAPIRPDETADFMTYTRRSWVSDYTWRALFSSLTQFFVAADEPAAAEPAPQSPVRSAQAPGGTIVIITGLVDTSGHRGEITTALSLPAESLPQHARATIRQPRADSPHQASNFRLRLLDPVGTIVAERPITPLHLDDHTDESDSATFADFFPQPAGPVARVELWSDDTLIDTLAPGSAAPTVAIHAPVAGTFADQQLAIAWTAEDRDPDDTLHFTVQYSHDNGARWHTLAVDASHASEGPHTLILDDLGTLHGSDHDTARIRVLVSDGYNTGSATSDGFTVANRVPQVVIASPGHGQPLRGGAAVIVQGFASDAEDGPIPDAAMAWNVDDQPAGTGRRAIIDGLPSGDHRLKLSATDANQQTTTASRTLSLAPVVVPLGPAPLLDGICTDATYTGAARLNLAPYPDGSQATALILRSADHLWACFDGLEREDSMPPAAAGLQLDLDNSRDALAGASDLQAHVGEDGSVTLRVGDSTGDYAMVASTGLTAQVGSSPVGWSAELRVDASRVGGWDHLVGLSVGHRRPGATGGDVNWPFGAHPSSPKTWSPTALGDLARLTMIDPYTATVGGPPFSLTLEGTGIVSGTVALWNGAELPTTFVDAEHLTANVDAGHLAPTGRVEVGLRMPGGLASNSLDFTIETSVPRLTSLNPTSVHAGGDPFTLIIEGSGFAADAQVLWNGEPMATRVVSSSHLEVPIPAERIGIGGRVGITVRNQQPYNRVSNALQLEIEPSDELPPTSQPSPTATATSTAEPSLRRIFIPSAHTTS